jgi:hypothetical protein
MSSNCVRGLLTSPAAAAAAARQQQHYSASSSQSIMRPNLLPCDWFILVNRGHLHPAILLHRSVRNDELYTVILHACQAVACHSALACGVVEQQEQEQQHTQKENSSSPGCSLPYPPVPHTSTVSGYGTALQHTANSCLPVTTATAQH